MCWSAKNRKMTLSKRTFILKYIQLFSLISHKICWNTVSCKYFDNHCTLQRKMPKVWNKYSQKRNMGASVPISIFMCLWANYIFPWWVCLFCWMKYVDLSWEYINRSQTHECGNWGWGRAIPRKGIYKRNCRCSVGERVESSPHPPTSFFITTKQKWLFATISKDDLIISFRSRPKVSLTIKQRRPYPFSSISSKPIFND